MSKYLIAAKIIHDVKVVVEAASLEVAKTFVSDNSDLAEEYSWDGDHKIEIVEAVDIDQKHDFIHTILYAVCHTCGMALNAKGKCDNCSLIGKEANEYFWGD